VTTVAALVAEAEKLRRAGRLADAETLCRQALALDANTAEAHHLLGVVQALGGRLDAAEASFRQALACRPDAHNSQCGLGAVLQLAGRLDEAIAAFRRAIEMAPRDAESHRGLAGALEQSGAHDEALASCRRAVELDPNHAASYNSLGVLLERSGQTDEAIACLQTAVRLNPGMIDAFVNLGAACDRANKPQEALAALGRALTLDPNSVGALVNLGSVWEGVGRHQEALQALDRAVALDPNSVDALVNRGLVLVWLGRLQEAQAALERACALRPNSSDARLNLGLALERQGDTARALDCFRQALALDPNSPEAHLNYGMALLRDGHLEEGWPEYEWRSRCERTRNRPRGKPRWQGEPIAGRTILLGEEQGLGDSLQFVRYARLVKDCGARVIVECRSELASLLASCPGVDAVVDPDAPLPDYDFYLPLPSLPGLFTLRVEDIPAGVPYLFPDPALVERWSRELAGEEVRVGITWQGNPEFRFDRLRSIPLERYAALLEVPGVRFYSLQMGSGREQLPGFAGGKIIDLSDRIRDFQDTAAIMRNLDLVIVSDSSPAHLAGALGIPTWITLSRVADWRWMLDREDNPWYPTMRLFRQRQPGGWGEVFQRIARDLQALARARDADGR
jgi:tetratricopeptide (TPR) repeat protein